MEMELSNYDKNVDHFLISTREDQFLVIFVDPKTGLQDKLTAWED
jgi:hypothetical protein